TSSHRPRPNPRRPDIPTYATRAPPAAQVRRDGRLLEISLPLSRILGLHDEALSDSRVHREGWPDQFRGPSGPIRSYEVNGCLLSLPRLVIFLALLGLLALCSDRAVRPTLARPQAGPAGQDAPDQHL